MSENGHGGARQYAGRKPGSKNKLSKSAQAQAAFAELIVPRLEEYFNVLHELATDTTKKPADRLAAVRELLDRGLGKPQEYVAIEQVDTSSDLPEWE